MLLLVLLVSSICIASIGVSALDSSKKQLNIINNQYTTIAVPSGQYQEKMFDVGSYSNIGIDSMLFSDGTRYIGPIDAENVASKSPDYFEADHRVLLSAYVEGGENLSSGTLDPLQYNFALDQYCYQLSVMALRCISVEETYYDWRNYKTCWAEFEIVDDVCRINAYDLPPYDDTIGIETKIFTKDGDIPFEVGKTYLVRGRYWDYDVRKSYESIIDDNGEEHVEWVAARDLDGSFKIRTMLIDPESPLMNTPSSVGIATGLENWILELRQYPDSDLLYWCTPEENCWPYYTEYEGEWKDFLNTKEGLVWKNEIIPYFEMNHASVPVILTDDVDSMYYFNSGDASLMEGSLFSDEDYEAGNHVCLISASYARVNNLSVGDIINLEYYQNGYEQYYYPITTAPGRTGMTVQRYPLSYNARIDLQLDYTVVGIYTAPEWEAGCHSFHADTIFVPKVSVPNADQYAGSSLTMLNSVIIQNGSIDEFEAHMTANDMAGAYLYYDQGYTEAAATVQTLIDNAQRIMIVGISMFILSALLFLLLYIRRATPVIATMRLLGVSSAKTWHECFMSLIWQIAIAVLLGNTLASMLYDRITQMLLSTSLELSCGSVIFCGSLQFLLLFVVGLIWTRSVANRNLMQKR